MTNKQFQWLGSMLVVIALSLNMEGGLKRLPLIATAQELRKELKEMEKEE